MKNSAFRLCVAIFLFASPFNPQENRPASQSHFDLVISGGRVIDPESGLDATRNLGITHGVIQAITAAPLTGRATIDAKGLTVAPGFIDLHQHDNDASDYALKALDGVTSALELENGTADVDAWYAERQGKALINYGVSAGHLAARVVVMHDPTGAYPSGDAAHRAASPKELEEIKSLLVRGLQRGAVAVGSKPGLAPAMSPGEVVNVFRVAADFHAPIIVHVRDVRADQESAENRLFLGFEEAVGAAAITGAPLHLAHIADPQLLRLVAEAQSRGLDVTTEYHSYALGSLPIQSAFFDPGWQQRMEIDFKDLQWAATGEQLTSESFARLRKTAGTGRVFYPLHPEEMVAAAVASPVTIISSDGNKFHPREAGTYSRVLGRYVRETKVLTLGEALRKMTIMPARRLERRAPMMKKKGRIRIGADADITIFDAQRIIDRATATQPAQPSEGVRYVLVNGVLVVNDGQLLNGIAPGQAIRAPVSRVSCSGCALGK